MMCTMLRRCTAVAVTVALAGASLPAVAQTPPARPAAPETPGDVTTQAAAHYARGVKLYQEDDFRAALIEFNRAYELAPNWAVLYNLGQSYYQLRDYPSALNTMEKYVQVGGANIPADRRSQVDREIGELRGRVAHVTLISNVAGADLTLDDASIGRTPLGTPIVVGEGRHKLTATKLGYVTTNKVVDIAGGDTLSIPIDLAQEPTPVVVRERRNYAPAVVSGAFGVAGIAVGTVFGVLALGNKSNLNSACNSSKICPSSSQNDIDGLSRNGAISTVGFAVGAAGLLVGGYFFFHEQSKPQDETAPAPPAARIAPWIGPGAGGLIGTF
jgi:hypothetical protein